MSTLWTDWGAAGIAFVIVVAAVSIVDFRTKYIHDWMLIVGALVCYPLLLWQGGSIPGILIGAVAGLAFYGIIYGLAYLFYRREAFGFGDVLFNGFLCGFLGWQRGIVASFLSFYIALIFVVAGAIKARKFDSKSELAFGPSMGIAAIIVMLYYRQIMALIMPSLLIP